MLVRHPASVPRTQVVIAAVSAMVYPSATLPVMVGVSSSAPSLKTLSVARLTCARFCVLCGYPSPAYTAALASLVSANCEVASLFEAEVASVRLG